MEQTIGKENGTNQLNQIPVALLITELAPGGAEKAFVHLALGLDKTRFQPTVFLLSGRRQDQENSMAPVLRSHGVETVELGMKSVFDLPRVLTKLYGELKRRRPLPSRAHKPRFSRGSTGRRTSPLPDEREKSQGGTVRRAPLGGAIRTRGVFAFLRERSPKRGAKDTDKI